MSEPAQSRIKSTGLRSQWLIALCAAACSGLLSLGTERKPHYTVHVFAVVRVKLTSIPGSTPQDAARLADALFNWPEHHRGAEFADEMTGYRFRTDVDSAETSNARFVSGERIMRYACSN